MTVGIYCRPCLPKTAGQNQTTRFQIYPLLLFYPETLISCPPVQIFHLDNTQSPASDSAIGLHLLLNSICAQHYDDGRFSIIAQGRSPFNLSVLEATFTKMSNPALCQQKQFVYTLQLKDCPLITLSHWSFSTNHSSAFSYPALSILIILLDKCQTKSFEDVIILIIVFYHKKIKLLTI